MFDLERKHLPAIPPRSSVYAEQSATCDLCGAEVSNLKNHVRMSSDEDHGQQGRYPEGWSGENTAPAPSTPANTAESDSAGTDVPTISAEDSSSDVAQEDDADDLESLTFGDDPADASDYECSACSDRLEYHQAECSCGEQPMWRAPR